MPFIYFLKNKQFREIRLNTTSLNMMFNVKCLLLNLVMTYLCKKGNIVFGNKKEPSSPIIGYNNCSFMNIFKSNVFDLNNEINWVSIRRIITTLCCNKKWVAIMRYIFYQIVWLKIYEGMFWIWKVNLNMALTHINLI